MPAAALHRRWLWLGLGWAIAAAIAGLSLAPHPPELGFAQGDKIGHLAGYGALMFWFCQLYAGRRSRLRFALGFAAMGVALEILQGATGYRSFEWLDMVANALGVAAGWALARIAGDRWIAALDAALARRRA